ncbi:metal-dependent transcriptional regulator [Streptococcus sp. 20925_1_22]|uniref:metal-dependent transcriptional regulator n=1 Tax=Streptococcus sp. 20925_1_22 TaxID=3003645 RepID=UPI0028D11EDB|nr:metal-dependent transcriptional regulator [uncultured Streptococcus sp.]
MTPNKEDYLKCIYEIGSRHKKITNKEIAQLMQVSPPAVTEMMKKMLAEELLVKDKKAGYLLTDLGLRLVSDLYRKHRLIEVFLVNHLGYSTDEIHEEAEVLEHTVSERFVERLDAMLQYPKTCPHGGTIPAKGELLDEENQLTLEEASAPGDYIIKRVHDDFDLLKYLEKYNLQIGQTITFIQYDSFAHVYLLKTETQEIQINPMIAQQIYVEKL